MESDRFEWDDRKARSNASKHGVTFEDAAVVFDDPDLVEKPDDDPDEERFIAIGRVGEQHLTVVYTERMPRLRIISAWKATAHEIQAYQQFARRPSRKGGPQK